MSIRGVGEFYPQAKWSSKGGHPYHTCTASLPPMANSSRRKRKGATNFKQIPLEVLKKLLARQAAKTKTAGTNKPTVETTLVKTEPTPVGRLIAGRDSKPRTPRR